MGNLKLTELPNGIETVNSFDPLGRMDKTTSWLGSTKIQEFAYGFDLVGNRVSEVDRNNDETTYDYDALPPPRHR